MAAVVDCSDDAIITQDLDGIITSWNKTAERLFGYTAKEVVGKPVALLVPPDRSDEEPAILARIRRGERIEHYETVRQRKEGTLLNISITVSPVKDDRAKIIGASQVARDISAQKDSQEALRFMAAIVQSSDDAIITKNLDGIITSWNGSAERLFGYTVAEAIGKPVAMLVPPDRESEEPGILARLRRGERIDHFETLRRHKDGTLLDISLTVSPVKDEHGTVIGASKVARDITHRKRMEHELNQARQSLSAANADLEKRVSERTASLQRAISQMEEFSYSVSHDLRSPIRAMKGYAATLLEDYAHDRMLDDDGRERLGRIVRSGDRMERLINDVLTYSRLARLETFMQPVAVDRLVADIIQQYDNLQPPNAQVFIRHPLQPVLAHEPSLTQVISNLLANGVKFVAPGIQPRVHVWTEACDGHVRLSIQDNGIGIKPEYQNRLFGMFERIHQNKEYEGTGIGLAIVRKAVEKMGGTVGVKSDGMTGSIFWIELDRAPETK